MKKFSNLSNLKYKLNKSNAISIGYLVQRDLSNADMDFVILTGYKWEFNKKKDKGLDLKWIFGISRELSSGIC